MASSNGQVFFDHLAAPTGEAVQSTDLAVAAGGTPIRYIYQQGVGHDMVSETIDFNTTPDQIEESIDNTSAEFGYEPTYVLLNFEPPFQSAIDRLGRAYYNGGDDPNDIAMRQQLILLVQEMKSRRPELKFSYYRVPNHRSHFLGGTTVLYLVQNPDEEITATEQPSGVTLTLTGAEWLERRSNERWMGEGPLCAELDFLAPSGYDTFPLSNFGSTTRGNPNNVNASVQELLDRRNEWPQWTQDFHNAFRNTYIMGICQYIRQQLGRPFMPILPHVNHYYITYNLPLEPDEYFLPLRVSVEDYINYQIKPYMDGGAAGFISWGADDFKTGVPFNPQAPAVDTPQAFTDGVDQKREAWVIDYPEVFGIDGEVDRYNDWRNVDWSDTSLREALKVARRDSRLEYIRRASQFVKTYGAARASTLAALGGATPSTP